MAARPMAALFFALSLLTLAFGAMFAGLLRDGLGPDSVGSSGGVAIVRFMEAFWLPGLIAVLFFCVGWYFHRRHRESQHIEEE
jgi:hypothetical protein